MNELKALLDLDFKYLFFGFCLILIVGKTLWITIEWLLIEKLGLETKKQKERREDKKLLSETAKLAKTTAEGLTNLENRHTKDEKQFRERLDEYIEDGQEDRQKINSLITAQKEMLAEKINEKYKYYLSIKGIPTGMLSLSIVLSIFLLFQLKQSWYLIVKNKEIEYRF